MIIQGDTLTILKAMKSDTIDMCLTSPPYWGLRDYGEDTKIIWGGNKSCRHEWEVATKPKKKSKQRGLIGLRGQNDRPSEYYMADRLIGGSSICKKCGAWRGQLGLEPTPEMFIDHLTEIFNEVKRVLKPQGTLWLNISDTYFGSGCGTNDYRTPASISISRPHLYRTPRPQNYRHHPYLKPKSLTMVPERLAWALIENGWILRNKIIWYKPNGMPSSAKDRLTNRWEYIFLFSKGRKYYFDLHAIREPYTKPLNRWGGNVIDIPKKTKWDPDKKARWSMSIRKRTSRPDPKGKNPGDHWEINTRPYPGAHFAVFPEELCETPIKAGCPEELCRKCGQPKKRIVEQKRINTRPGRKTGTGKSGKDNDPNKSLHNSDLTKHRQKIIYKTIGTTSCRCNAGFKPGIVLDPFCGSGTTGAVAKRLGRRAILIDIKYDFCLMAKKRIDKVARQLSFKIQEPE